jgi:hypothetical protein
MNNDNDKKNPWFGQKMIGFGIGPRSWQGWLISLLGIIAELSIITLFHHLYPAWFVAKTNGSGFNPKTWQGWLAIVTPIVVLMIVIYAIYSKQRKD